jgi:hypothetical protein
MPILSDFHGQGSINAGSARTNLGRQNSLLHEAEHLLTKQSGARDQQQSLTWSQ